MELKPIHSVLNLAHLISYTSAIFKKSNTNFDSEIFADLYYKVLFQGSI